MTVLIVAEHDNSTLSERTARCLSAARQIGETIDLLVAGNACAPVADAAARLGGVARVLLAEHPALADRGPEVMAELILSIAASYEAICAPNSSMGKATLPRVAAKLDVMQVSDIVEVVSPDTFNHPIYAGNAIETVQCAATPRVVTVRTSAFPPVADTGAAPVEAVAFAPTFTRSRLVTPVAPAAGRPALAAARVVVSGGRAFASKEQFDALLDPLADKLGAAVGASRAAVDAGFASSELQVGQTGQVVAPELYIACGISGAIQHVAGMRESKTIVAINADPEAPIFKVADYGLVGDIFTLLPELTARL